MIDLGAVIFARHGEARPTLAWDNHLLLQPKRAAGNERPVDIYRELIGGLYDTTVSARQAERFAVDAHRAVIGPVAVAQGVWSGHRIERTPRHVRTGEAGFVRVLFREEGSAITRIGDDVYINNRPTVVLADQGRGYTSVTSDFRSTQIYLPYELVGYDPSRHPAMVCVPADTPRGRILANFLRSICGELLTASGPEADAIVNGAGALFRVMLLSEATAAGRASFQQARAAAMRAYLRQNVKNPALGLHDLLRNFGASRATVFRDFEAYGGIANFITETRLQMVAVDLMETAPKAGVVTRLSEKYGFSSPQYFSRLFRERTGLLPSDLVGAGPVPGAT